MFKNNKINGLLIITGGIGYVLLGVYDLQDQTILRVLGKLLIGLWFIYHGQQTYIKS